ncbi:MAG: hypothetical protein ABSA16_17395 [Thermoguttaceae bacterium]
MTHSTLTLVDVQPTPVTLPIRSYTELMAKEVKAFLRCESMIKKGIKTFVEVGKALLEIRDHRYYRDNYDTFENYCKEKWGFARRTAYQYIEAAEVTENVCHGAQIEGPANERQARELAKLPDEEQAEAWEEVIERADGKPTAVAVREVVEERLGDDSSGAVDRHEDDTVRHDDGHYNFSNCNNAVAFILKFLEDGQFHSQKNLDTALSAPEYAVRSYVNEVKSSIEQSKRKADVDLTTKMGYLVRFVCFGRGIINTTLNALVWLDIVDRVENGAQVSYRLLKNPFDITYPNCGAHEADDDGDCTSCHEPGLVAMEGGE